MMDPIKFKDEAYQAKTRGTLPDTWDERVTPARAGGGAAAILRTLASALRRLVLAARGTLPGPARTGDSETATVPAASCSC